MNPVKKFLWGWIDPGFCTCGVSIRSGFGLVPVRSFSKMVCPRMMAPQWFEGYGPPAHSLRRDSPQTAYIVRYPRIHGPDPSYVEFVLSKVHIFFAGWWAMVLRHERHVPPVWPTWALGSVCHCNKPESIWFHGKSFRTLIIWFYAVKIAEKQVHTLFQMIDLFWLGFGCFFSLILMN